MLDDRPRDADGVAFLEGVEADRRRRHLAGDDHHRDRVHVRGGDAGYGVRHARARGHQGNAHLAGGSRIAVGGVDRGLLVPDEHVLDRLLLVQRVVDVEHRAAGVAPDVLDAFGLQATNEDFGAVRLLRRVLRLCRSGTLDFRGRHVHFEPLRISLTKNHRCPFSRPREAESEPARSKTAARCRTAGLRPLLRVAKQHYASLDGLAARRSRRKPR